jgi:hypothetical protein
MENSNKGEKVEIKRSTTTPDQGKDQDEVHYHYHMGYGAPGGYYRQGQAAGGQPQQPPGVHYHYYYEPPKKPKRRSSKPSIAGAMLIIRAIAVIIIAVFMMSTGIFFGDLGEGFDPFQEDAKGDVHGYVMYTNQTPVEGASVSIVGETLSATTDENGYYLIYNVPSGNQKVQVEKPGYNTIVYKTFVSPSDVNIVTHGNGEVDRDDRNGDLESGNKINFTLTEGSETLERGEYPPFEEIRNVMLVCAVVAIILAIIMIIGGFFAIKRQRYGLAILGSIIGIISIGILPIIALFILLISREEFKKSESDA